MADNSDETARVNRGIGRPFPRGVSGNPGGRPKGIVKLVRAMTSNGEELVKFMTNIMRGEEKEARLADRIKACEWLAERGFGRTLSVADVEGQLYAESVFPTEVLLESIARDEIDPTEMNQIEQMGQETGDL